MVTQLSVPAQSASSIAEEVAQRRADRSRIRRATKAFLADVRGIPDFPDRADAALPLQSDALTLCLGRQIPTACIEHIAMDFYARWLSTTVPSIGEMLGLSEDSWGKGGYKESLVNLPLIKAVRTDKVTVRSISIIPEPMRDILNKHPVMSSISVQAKQRELGMTDTFAGSLFTFHSSLREKAGLSGKKMDLSLLFSDCVRLSRKPPPTVFCSVNGCAVAKPAECIPQETFVRPPASWFYLAYLCLFLTGERALVATDIGDDDENIQQLFADSIALIKDGVGVEPLILQVPHHSDRLVRSTGGPISHPVDYTEIHPAVFQGGWRDHITLPPQDVSFYEAAEMILHQLATMPVPVRERVM